MLNSGQTNVKSYFIELCQDPILCITIHKKPFFQDLDVLAAHLNELGADDKATTTVIIEDDKSDEEEEEEVVNRDGTLLASEPARPL